MTRSLASRLTACALALVMPLASAQNYQETQRQYDEQRRKMLEEREEARKKEEARRTQDVMDDQLKRSLERDQQRGQATSQGSSGNFDLMGTVVTLTVLASLAELFLQGRGSRQPSPAQAPSPQELERAARMQRQAFVTHQCVKVRRTELQPPKYEAPNSWALVRVFQPDPRKAYQEALQRYEQATRETGPICSCLGQRAVSDNGFAEPEWQAITQRARSRDARPWMALEPARVKEVFDACSGLAPSDRELSWLFPRATP